MGLAGAGLVSDRGLACGVVRRVRVRAAFRVPRAQLRLVLRLHPLGRLVGGKLAQLDGFGAQVGSSTPPPFRVLRGTALPALGREELRSGIVAKHSAGKALRFERVSFVSGVQLDLRNGRGFARVAHLGVLAGALLADALGPALDLASTPWGDSVISRPGVPSSSSAN